METTTGWVFISHSHLDIEVVRRIRNKLERMGFNPLTFYLKCLTDDDEVADLIKREIRVRDWFVFVNSENSRKSRWVSTERDFIEEIGGKNVFVIDASISDSDLENVLEKMSSRMQVTIASVKKDAEYREMMEQMLLSHDYVVLSRELDSPPETEDDFRGLLGHGTTFLIVSENCLLSAESLRIMETYFHERKGLIPVFEKSEAVESMADGFLIYRVIDLGGGTINKESFDKTNPRFFTFVRQIISIMQNDFHSTESFRSARKILYPERETVPDYAFTDCELLEEVTIPDSVIYISSKAFHGKESVLVKCRPGSHAEEFCKRHGMKYELV